jgi:hypothetical protein
VLLLCPFDGKARERLEGTKSTSSTCVSSWAQGCNWEGERAYNRTKVVDRDCDTFMAINGAPRALMSLRRMVSNCPRSKSSRNTLDFYAIYQKSDLSIAQRKPGSTVGNSSHLFLRSATQRLNACFLQQVTRAQQLYLRPIPRAGFRLARGLCDVCELTCVSHSFDACACIHFEGDPLTISC